MAWEGSRRKGRAQGSFCYGLKFSTVARFFTFETATKHTRCIILCKMMRLAHLTVTVLVIVLRCGDFWIGVLKVGSFRSRRHPLPRSETLSSVDSRDPLSCILSPLFACFVDDVGALLEAEASALRVGHVPSFAARQLRLGPKKPPLSFVLSSWISFWCWTSARSNCPSSSARVSSRRFSLMLTARLSNSAW